MKQAEPNVSNLPLRVKLFTFDPLLSGERGPKLTGMPIDLEAAKQALKYHCTDAACRSTAQCCEIGSGETVGALILEIERLEAAAPKTQAEWIAGLRKAFPPTRAELHVCERWIPVAERLPEPKIWYVGLVVSTDIDFDTKERMRVVRLVRGYPREDEPKDLFPDITHWMPLPEPPK